MSVTRYSVALAAFSLAVLFAQSPQATPSQPGAPAGARRPGNSFLISRPVPTKEAVERGQKAYVANCGFCHGSNAKGGETGPDLVRSVVALRDENGELIGPIVKGGRPDKGMPAFPNLTDDQIKDIAAFLRDRQQAAINRGAYKIQNIVTGDPHKGEAYFQRACASCHSPSGDLKGIAGKFDPVALQARFLYPETRAFGPGGRRANGGAPKSVTITLPSGQTISGNLEYIDDYNVALRETNGSYHSFSREGGLKVDVRDPLAGHQALLKQYTDADMHNILAYLETLK